MISLAESERAYCYRTTNECEYDVHICYYGPGIQDTLIGHLKHAFCEKGIKTTIDGHWNIRGEEISQTTLEAIEKSTCSILVFSDNFAFSPRCLDEVVKIIECAENGQVFRGIYFRVDPSEVRNLGGSYEKAMAGHREKFEEIKVIRWEVNLHKAAKLPGWTYENGCQATFIQEFVAHISGILNHALLYNADGLGGPKPHTREPQSRLASVPCDVDTVRKNGIRGIDAQHKVLSPNFPNTAPLGPLFTRSHRNESENGEGVIMVQPSTSTSASQVSIPREIEGGLISRELMGAFLASRGAENYTLSAIQDAGNVATRASEVKSAMQAVGQFVSRKFHELIPEGSEFVDYIKEIVLSFGAGEKIPQGMVAVLEKIILCFTQWSQDYEDANTVLATKNADLLKIDQLQEEFKALVIDSKLAVAAENEVRIQLDRLLRRKGELEEELKAVTHKIDELSSSCQAVAVRKSLLLEKGTTLKTEKDNMEVRLPRIMGDLAAASVTQERIEAEWSKLGKVFNEVLMSEFGCT